MTRPRRLSHRSDVLFIGLRAVGKGHGGVESHVDQLAHELDRLGYRIEIAVRTAYAGSEVVVRDKNTRTTPIWSTKGSLTETITHSFLTIIYAAIHRPRLVHIHAIGPSLVAPFARMLGLQVIITHHGEDFLREKWGRFAKFILRTGEFLGARFANQRICISPSLSFRLSEIYNRQFVYIPNGVRRERLSDTDATLREFGLERGSYILTVSRLVPEKRHVDLINAFAELDVPELKLVIVGGANHDSDYSRLLKTQADEVPGVVLTGFQRGLPLAELFSHAAVFALPSSHEGLPIALLEAMSYGCRLVASDIQPNIDVSLPEQCYFSLGNIQDLTDCLGAAFAVYGSEGRVDWSSELVKYDWEVIAKKTAEIYARVGVLPIEDGLAPRPHHIAAE